MTHFPWSCHILIFPLYRLFTSRCYSSSITSNPFHHPLTSNQFQDIIATCKTSWVIILYILRHYWITALLQHEDRTKRGNPYLTYIQNMFIHVCHFLNFKIQFQHIKNSAITDMVDCHAYNALTHFFNTWFVGVYDYSWSSLSLYCF